MPLKHFIENLTNVQVVKGNQSRLFLESCLFDQGIGEYCNLSCLLVHGNVPIDQMLNLRKSWAAGKLNEEFKDFFKRVQKCRDITIDVCGSNHLHSINIKVNARFISYVGSIKDLLKYKIAEINSEDYEL